MFLEGWCHQTDYVYCIIYKAMKNLQTRQKNWFHSSSIFILQSCSTLSIYKTAEKNIVNKLVLQPLWINKFTPCLVIHEWHMLMNCMILIGECWGPLWDGTLLFYKKQVLKSCAAWSCSLSAGLIIVINLWAYACSIHDTKNKQY